MENENPAKKLRLETDEGEEMLRLKERVEELENLVEEGKSQIKEERAKTEEETRRWKLAKLKRLQRSFENLLSALCACQHQGKDQYLAAPRVTWFVSPAWES